MTMNVPLRQYWDLFRTYLRPQWRRVLGFTFLLLIDIGLKLAGPLIVARFIDTARGGSTLPALVSLAGLYVAVTVLDDILVVTSTYIGEQIGWMATNGLRSDLARHCLGLDLSFHKNHTPGELIERIDGDVATLSQFFSRFASLVLGTSVFMLAVLVLLFRLDWRVGASLTVFIGLALVWLDRTRSIAVPRWAAARQVDAELFSYLEERLSGTEDIRSSGATGYVMNGLYRLSRARLQASRLGRVMDSSLWASTTMLFTLGTALALALGAMLYTSGRITLGGAWLIFQYTEMLRQPAEMLNRQLQDLQKAGASVGRIRQLLALESAIVDQGNRKLPAGPLAVDFERVTFQYQPDNVVLQDVSFWLPPSRTLGILGRTGSGKTTLTRLVFRLHEPAQGAIRLGGVNIREVPVFDLRSHVGLVTQDVQLFRTSVRDNLTFFDPGISDDHIRAILRELGLSAWYQSLPDGLDTVLESGHSGLSAGEAQLLALVRVFLKDPGVVILDEASSRLDPATEALLERVIDRLLRDRTGIVIAHRLGTIHRADDILILENGQIREYGERVRLMADPDSRFSELLRTGLEEALA